MAKVNLSSPKVTIIALALLFFGPMMLAYFYVNFFPSSVETAGKAAKGQLIMPAKPMESFQVEKLGGGELPVDFFKGKWTYVTFTPGSCGQECVDNLYKIRQIRLTQPEDIDRIQRLLVLTDASAGQALVALLKEHPGLEVAKGNAASVGKFMQQFTGQETMPAHLPVYMVDPLGNIFMHYEATANPSDMKKDLARLMKYSKIG